MHQAVHTHHAAAVAWLVVWQHLVAAGTHDQGHPKGGEENKQFVHGVWRAERNTVSVRLPFALAWCARGEAPKQRW